MSAVLVAVQFAALANTPVLWQVPQLQVTARKANGGELGCGAGGATFITSRGEVKVPLLGLDPIHVFSPTIKTADLLTLLKSRAESNRTGKPGPMSGAVTDLCYVCLVALAESKEPDAVPVLADLLTDKEDTVRGWAAITLFRLGDTDPTLRAEIRKVRFPKEALTHGVGQHRPPAWLGTGLSGGPSPRLTPP